MNSGYTAPKKNRLVFTKAVFFDQARRLHGAMLAQQLQHLLHNLFHVDALDVDHQIDIQRDVIREAFSSLAVTTFLSDFTLPKKLTRD